jgi:hypothetical protein
MRKEEGNGFCVVSCGLTGKDGWGSGVEGPKCHLEYQIGNGVVWRSEFDPEMENEKRSRRIQKARLTG